MEIKWPKFPDLIVNGEIWPEAENARSYQERRSIVEQHLVELITSGDLYLTELMNQEMRVVRCVGDVILGFGLSDGQDGHVKASQTHEAPPLEVAEATVLIESIDRGCKLHRPEPDPEGKCKRCERDAELGIAPGKQPLRYTDGMERITDRRAGQARLNKSPQPQMRERIIDLKVTEKRVSLRQAWLILKEAGAYVKRAAHQDGKELDWLYREVPPAELRERGASTSGSKGKRGG